MTDSPSTPNGNHSKTVLVVDDNAFSCELIAGTLEGMGVTNVRTADNGRSALGLIKTLPQVPDLLVCDIFMPDMDGIEFLSALTDLHYSGRILLASGLDVNMMAVAKTVAETGGLHLVGAFTKPLTPEVLAHALDL
jgi:CheY-like chemotaxis protein